MNAIVKEDFAKESGHFYKPDGSPIYTVPNASKPGEMRPTTVRDARKHGYVVSVTTVLRQASAPALVNWMKEQVAKAAYSSLPREGECEADYVARVLPLAEEVARVARDRGTEIHGAIEKGDVSGPWAGHVSAAIGALDGWVGEPLQWDSERSFASPLGFGGKLDVSAPGYVADYKTSDKPLEGLKLWPEHRRQLSAYRMGLDMPTARCAIVYVSATEPAARVIELAEEELQQGWNEFKALLAFYYHANRMELPNAKA